MNVALGAGRASERAALDRNAVGGGEEFGSGSYISNAYLEEQN